MLCSSLGSCEFREPLVYALFNGADYKKVALALVLLACMRIWSHHMVSLFVFALRTSSLPDFTEKQINPDFIRRFDLYPKQALFIEYMTEDFTTFLLWSVVELNVDMICACLPTLLPIARKLPRSQRLLDSSKALLSFSWLRSSSRDAKASYSDSHSMSSFKML